jgi:hypothetical protein
LKLYDYLKFSTASISGCGKGWSFTDCDFSIELVDDGAELLILAPDDVVLWLVVEEVEALVVDVPPSPNPSLDESVVLFEGVKLGTFSDFIHFYSK